MSRYTVKKPDGRVIHYGLDKPTGGFFWQELDSDDDEIAGKDGMTFSDLKIAVPEVKDIRSDWDVEKQPTPQQINVGLMFGTNIVKLLLKCKDDLKK